MNKQQKIVDIIFKAQAENGCWKTLPANHKYYPDYLHYVPNFKATLWTLILLADLGHDKNDERVKKPLEIVQQQFFNKKYGIFSLKEDHFPIPCLNGNMIYIDSYFNGFPGKKSLKALAFFCKYQRFDDGCYIEGKSEFCTNKSCYGKHTCYWGITKLFKGISFIPKEFRSTEINDLLEKCVQFVLLHKICFSSHKKDKLLAKGMDKLTFPNMYKSDFLEILWLLKREKVKSDKIYSAIKLLTSKQLSNGAWNLEKKVHNMETSIGEVNRVNSFVSQRANEVLEFYKESL
jgi:hypothetical protein